jgi:quercetin dioxygenase-like cupin family protein
MPTGAQSGNDGRQPPSAYRCPYFRDVGYGACNKRVPGSGCAAIGGENRWHAVLGTSENCIAANASDLAVALVALEASVEVRGANGRRTVPLAEFHRLPGDSPHIETVLEPGEVRGHDYTQTHSRRHRGGSLHWQQPLPPRRCGMSRLKQGWNDADHAKRLAPVRQGAGGVLHWRRAVDPMFQAGDPARVSGGHVTFEPGARSAWHTHPLGQTLIVTSGLGWAQAEGGPIEEIRPGDVVWFPPGLKHWHGATPATAMTHIAITES